jgi:hypothetical protein
LSAFRPPTELFSAESPDLKKKRPKPTKKMAASKAALFGSWFLAVFFAIPSFFPLFNRALWA